MGINARPSAQVVCKQLGFDPALLYHLTWRIMGLSK